MRIQSLEPNSRISENTTTLWSFLAFLSSVAGLVCFGLSSSFKHLFGEWNHLKMILYIITSLIICNIVLFAKRIQVSQSFMVKSHVGFLVLMLTSLYSYFYDKSVNGKPDAMSIISYAAFAFMSFCLSRKMELGFEVGLFNFFLGCLTVQLMKISLILAFAASIFCYSLIILRCYLDSQLEIGNEATRSEEDYIKIVIDTATQKESVGEDVNHLMDEMQNQTSSTSDVAGESNYEKNLHIEDDKKLVEEMQNQASSTSNVAGESNCDENLQNMKDDENKNKNRNNFLRRRKNAVKRTVRVPAVSSKISDIPPDEYLWRKYGQKPIKGTPDPRGYYKCSTVKGCPARKTVERATDDPTVLIVTYVGEHRHRILDAMRENVAELVVER